MLRKSLKVIGILIGLIIILGLVLPFFFKDKIIAAVQKGVNDNIYGTVDFSDVNLSFFRHFPSVAVGIQDVIVIGAEDFSKDTLLQVKRLDVAVNIWSIIGGDKIKINTVILDVPKIHAIVNKAGKANWDIMKTTPSETDAPEDTSSFHLELQQYQIRKGNILYEDIPGSMYLSIRELNHAGSGDFTKDVFTLDTRTTADAVNFVYEGIPYLNSVNAVINTDLKIDNAQNLYSFNTDAINLNDLQLNTSGSFQILNDSTYNMDIQFKTPDNTFKSLLSLIPAIYAKDFDKINTSGTAAIEGFIKGNYNAVTLPAFNVSLMVKDGFFQYPDLPKPVKNIQIDATVSNPDGLVDNTVIEVRNGHLEMDAEPFDFKLIFKNPETLKYIDASVKGSLDLSKIIELIKLEKDTRLAGIIHADAFAKGNMGELESGQGSFSAGGFLQINALEYAAPAIPQPISNGSMRVDIVNTGGVADQTNIAVSNGHIEFGKDPIDFDVKIQKPITDILFNGSAKGKFDLATVQQLVELEPGTTLSGILSGNVRFEGSNKLIENKQYDQIKFGGVLNAENIAFASKDYPTGVTISTAMVTLNNDDVVLNNLKGLFDKTNFAANGVLNNLLGYALQDESLQGKLNLHADNINLNSLLGADPDTSATTNTTSAPFLVPANIHFALNTSVDKLQYDKVQYSNITGNLLIANETATLQNLQMNALDGSINLSGKYSTLKNKKEPEIQFTYHVKNLDLQKTFLAFNTVQKLMPIAQFLGGKISSDLVLNGRLDGGMMPLLNSLNGEGTLFLIDGFLRKFQPLEQLATALNISELNNLSLKDVKNYIEFTNGKVLVKPFTIKVKDIEMEIGGMHGLDQSIDYVINLKMPRSKLGTQGNNLINNLVTQANNKGLPVKVSETINLYVGMKGSIAHPTLQYNLKETVGDIKDQFKDQATEFIQTALDSAKTALKDTAQAIKNELLKSAEAELKKKLFGQNDSTAKDSTNTSPIKKAEEAVKSIKDIFKKKKE